MTWSVAFVWTLALELPIAALVLRGRFARGAFFLAFLSGNLATHPIVWQLVPRFENYRTGCLVMESFAVVVEATSYVLGARFGAASIRASGARCFVAALLANGFSAGVGPILIERITSSG